MSFSGWCCQFWTGAYGAARLGGRRVSLDSRRSSCMGRNTDVKPQEVQPGLEQLSGGLFGLRGLRLAVAKSPRSWAEAAHGVKVPVLREV